MFNNNHMHDTMDNNTLSLGMTLNTINMSNSTEDFLMMEKHEKNLRELEDQKWENRKKPTKAQ